ncbi:MAG: sulfatase [Verrucomicrobiota bacterium]
MTSRFRPMAFVCAALLLAFAASAAPARQPNIVLFLVDDMGWMDCGAYGSKYYDTPNMDKLATRGMLFTDCYSANPLCSPTRAAILTGQYPARHGITTASGHQPPQPPGYVFLPDKAPPNRPVITPESKNYLEPSQYTIAEALHDAGYRTAHLGKWHLGLTEPYWPDKQGFDVAFHGKPDPGPPSYFSPYGFRQFQSFKDGPPGEYIMDRLAAEAEQFIEQSQDKPFLLHLWSYGVHGPWGHKEEYTKRYAGRKDPRGKQGNPIMASMLKSVDECLGRIIAKLDALKLTDNTIIIFTSDNGGNVHSNIEGDRRTQKKADDPRLADWRKWAGNQPPTNNDPLRAGKGTLYEGGVRIPLIVVWPGVVKPGARNSTPVCSIDFYPTMLALTGVPKKPEQIVDGKNLLPLLKQTGPLDRPALFNYFPHGNAGKPPGVTVRAGDWKLIRWYETSPLYPDARELYNLRDDLGESKNLAKQMPDKVKELDALIDQFLKDTKALAPKPNPDYQPGAARPTAAAPAATGDALLGWVPKSAKTSAVEGALRVEADGRAPFIATVQLKGLKHEGPVTLQYRLRTAQGGAGKVQWRTAAQEQFPAEGQVVEFNLAGGNAWQEGAIELPVAGQVAHIRFYPPVQRQPVDVDWLRLAPSGKSGAKPLAWDFAGAVK